MKKLFFIGLPLVACSFFANFSVAEEMQEIIVTSSLIDTSASEISNPLHIVDGESVANDATRSIGASIGDLAGLAYSDYGAAVGQPIIRGMSGNRVKVLNNGMVVRDISGLGADHINDVDLNNIQQIEVVKGPSSLLYANGTIGGIINVVDSTIARTDFSETDLQLGLESQSVNDGKTHNLSYQDNLAGLNLSAAYKDAQFGNFDIPHGAVIHDEEEDLGYLDNSDSASTSKRLGISKTGDWGYFGLSFNNSESVYGIPFHGEAHEEHEGEEHKEEEGHEEEEHKGERIFSTTDSDISNLEGSYILNNRWLQKVNYYFRDSDYSLTEQHSEGHDESAQEPHEEEESTVFKNNATEYGAIFDLSNDSLAQKVVVNFVEEDISIIGEEAFMKPAENKEITLGYYLSKELDLFHLDFGIRYDQIGRTGSVIHKENNQEEHYDRDINNTSFALSLSRDINKLVDISLGFAQVERAPSAVELFMNGPHLATGKFEVGKPNLKSEKSSNIDLTFNYENNGFFAVLNLFRNDVGNYIYLLDETEEEHDAHDGEEDHAGLIAANYLQQDAEFNGYEIEAGKTFNLAGGELSISLGKDSVSGKFANGANIPRMTPDRDLYKVSYMQDGLKVSLSLKDVKKQADTAVEETATDGYQMLDVNLSKTVKFSSGNNLILSVFGKNLLDEAARNHSSFVKDKVPLPGRNIGIRASYSF